MSACIFDVNPVKVMKVLLQLFELWNSLVNDLTSWLSHHQNNKFKFRLLKENLLACGLNQLCKSGGGRGCGGWEEIFKQVETFCHTIGLNQTIIKWTINAQT